MERRALLKLATAAVVVGYRVVLSIALRTAYVPDEYFQFLEPASRHVHGVGISSWEWQPEYELRSFLPIVPTIVVARILGFLGVSSITVTEVARTLHVLLVLLADLCFHRLCSPRGPTFATIATAVNLFSWSGSYMLPRTLANSVEQCLVVIGCCLLVEFTRGRKEALTPAMLVIAISSYIRPTVALYWIPLVGHFLINRLLCVDKHVLLTALAAGTSALQIGLLVDSFFYDHPSLPPWNFVRVNVLESRALSFGVKPWYFNVVEAVPVLLGLYAPLMLVQSVLDAMRSQSTPSTHSSMICAAWVYVGLLSLATRHQEHRFVLAVMPHFHLVVAEFICAGLASKRRVAVRISAVAMVMTHVGFALYLLTAHQGGGERALKLLRQRHLPQRAQADVLLVGPCHSLPGYAHVYSHSHPVRLHSPHCPAPWDPTAISFDKQLPQFLSSAMSAFSDTSKVFVVTFDVFLPQVLTSSTRRWAVLENITHAHVRYDLDDPQPKYHVLVLESIPLHKQIT